MNQQLQRSGQQKTSVTQRVFFDTGPPVPEPLQQIEEEQSPRSTSVSFTKSPDYSMQFVPPQQENFQLRSLDQPATGWGLIMESQERIHTTISSSTDLGKLTERRATIAVAMEEVIDQQLDQIRSEVSRSVANNGQLMISKTVNQREAAKLKKLQELGRKKQARFVEQNRKRQAMYFGQTQYKFFQTTNEHGALLNDEAEYDGEEQSQAPTKSLWEKTQESTKLFSCFRCCRRGAVEQEEDSDQGLGQNQRGLLQSFQMLDSSSSQVDEFIYDRGPMKKLVVPNNHQDKWLVYLLTNLNKANDLFWVNKLLEKIEANQDEFNAGKFRGAVFQMNFIAKENLKMRPGGAAKSGHFGGFNQRNNQNGSAISVQKSQDLGRVFAGQSIVASLELNQKLNESVSADLLRQMIEEKTDLDQNTEANITSNPNRHSNAEFSILQYQQSQSQVSVAGASVEQSPLEFASRLCRLVNKFDPTGSSSLSKVETLDNLSGMIRKIYIKIREQLEDPSHPIIQIIAQFQEVFRQDFEKRLEDFQANHNRINSDFSKKTEVQFEQKLPRRMLQSTSMRQSSVPQEISQVSQARKQSNSLGQTTNEEMVRSTRRNEEPLYVQINEKANSLHMSRSVSNVHLGLYNSFQDQLPNSTDQPLSTPLEENVSFTEQRLTEVQRSSDYSEQPVYTFKKEQGDMRDMLLPQDKERGFDDEMYDSEETDEPVETALQEMVNEALRQLKTFLIIIYGCCVRFYSTVVDWEYIQRMSEDLIERMTSKLFEDASFSEFVVQLCGELTREQDDAYQRIKRDFASCIPKDVGINPYFTIDHTSKIEQVFMQNHPELNLGDSGSIEGQGTDPRSTARAIYNSMLSNQSQSLETTLAPIPEEIMSEHSSVYKRYQARDVNVEALDEDEEVKDIPNPLLSQSVEFMGGRNSQQTAAFENKATLSDIRKRMRRENIPYIKCINQLNKMGDKNGMHTPLSKMNCITEISSCIKQEVHDFWEGVEVDQKKLTLDAEQIAMIYEYVTIKADVKNIFAQIRFCREFSTKFIRNMKQGFCLVTLEMALGQLIEFPELIGAADEEEESDARWSERTRSIGSSMRNSNFAQISSRKQTQQFSLAVPKNILAPIVKLEPSKQQQDRANRAKRGMSMHIHKDGGQTQVSQQLPSAALNSRNSMSSYSKNNYKERSQLLL